MTCVQTRPPLEVRALKSSPPLPTNPNMYAIEIFNNIHKEHMVHVTINGQFVIWWMHKVQYNVSASEASAKKTTKIDI